MKDVEVKIAYNRLGKSLEVSVNGATFTTAADSGVETFVEWLGDQLTSQCTNTIVLDAKPYDCDKIVDAHIVSLRVPAKDEISRK